MNFEQQFDILIQQELKLAESAREQGKEGMARVCARRAVGIAIGEYLQRRGDTYTKKSAYERIRYLHTQANITPQIRDVTEHLLIRVTPSHDLPINVDLLAEARWLINTLLE